MGAEMEKSGQGLGGGCDGAQGKSVPVLVCQVDIWFGVASQQPFNNLEVSFGWH